MKRKKERKQKDLRRKKKKNVACDEPSHPSVHPLSSIHLTLQLLTLLLSSLSREGGVVESDRGGRGGVEQAKAFICEYSLVE